MRLLALFFLIVLGCKRTTSIAATPEVWEHGYRTPNVIATRYANEMVGFNIGFTFPNHPYDCDRAEISEWFEYFSGNVYQGGGYAGAEVFVVFDNVKDVETANNKLLEILPELDQFIQVVAATRGGAKVPMPDREKPARKVWTPQAHDFAILKPDSAGYWWVHRWKVSEGGKGEWVELREVSNCYPTKNGDVFYDDGKMLTIHANDNDRKGVCEVSLPIDVYISQQKQYGWSVEFVKLKEKEPFNASPGVMWAMTVIWPGDPEPKPWVKPKPDVPWSDPQD
jgi:hypothetical protein